MKNFKDAYADEIFYGLQGPVSNVVGAMGKAMWTFAQIKEITWYQWGYAGITGAIHWLEHICGDYIDEFKDTLAQIGRPLIYPAIPAFTGEIRSLPEAFDYCIGEIDRVNKALSDFIEAADTERYEPLARKAENIQMRNFAPRAWLTQAAVMSYEPNSASSVDSWLKNTLDAPQKG